MASARRYFPLLLISLSLAVRSGFAQQSPFETPEGLKYLMYTPSSYNAGVETPVLIVLHGQSEIGDNLGLLTQSSAPFAPTRLIALGQWPSSYPFIVVSPQMKPIDGLPYADHEWDPDSVDAVLEHVKTLRNVDTDRVYLTGLSLGGSGVWIYAVNHPEKIAAIVPISGKTNLAIDQACNLVDIPVWVFHGSEDNLLSTSFPIDMVNAINGCGDGHYAPELTFNQSRGHEGWNEIMNRNAQYEIYTWMLQFSKNDFTNRPPYVHVGSDFKVLQEDGATYIYGVNFDVDGSIANRQWTKVSGPAVTINDADESIVELADLQVGTYVFQFQVTDDDGASSSDQLTLQVFNNATAPTYRVTELVLVDGASNLDIGNLDNSTVINKAVNGLYDYTFRPTTSGSIQRVRYRVNGHQYISHDGLPARLRRNGEPWDLQEMPHVICAVPYASGSAGAPEGISRCFKIEVYSDPIRSYYPKPGQELSLLSTWGTNTNGSGTAPTSFASNFQTFNITSAATQNNSWSVSGSESKVVIGSGGDLSINNSFSGPIEVGANANVTVNTSTVVAFESISPSSTIEYEAAATTLPTGATFGNLVLSGTSTKILASDSTIVMGDLTIANNTTVNGAVDGSSIVSIAGDANILEDGAFNPATRFGLHFTAAQPHTLSLQSASAAFSRIHVGINSATALQQPGGTIVQLGSASGGGLVIESNGSLNIGDTQLQITGAGSVNSNLQSGRIGTSLGHFIFNTTGDDDSYIRTMDGMDTVITFRVNATGAGSVSLLDTVNVTDSVKISNGTLNSGGYLALLSNAEQTARLASIEGTGLVNGDVQVQRYVDGESIYKYLSFPVAMPVSTLQQYIPVTGGFDGADTGPGLTNGFSLYYYDEPSGGWQTYPNLTNSETLTPGTGYSLYLWPVAPDTAVHMTGPIQQTDFEFTLSPDPDTDNTNDGWNLLGNPFPAPVRWGPAGWTTTGVAPAVYVRDNNVPNGRFLVWDGSVGDPEFGGRIALGQSFWVRTTSGTPELAVSELAKNGAQDAELFRTQGEVPYTLTLEVKLGNAYDRAFIKFTPDGNPDFGEARDAVKRYNPGLNLSTKTADDVQLAINDMPEAFCSETISLSLTNAKVGAYTFHASGAFLEDDSRIVYLNDKALDSLFRLEMNQPYAFAINATNVTLTERFELILESALLLPEIVDDGVMLVSNSKNGNQWMLNGEDIPGATASSYTPLVSGDYSLRVSDAYCSRTSEPLSWIVTSAENTRDETIHVYPNPAKGVVYVKGRASAGGVYYQLIDVTGREVQDGRLAPGARLAEGEPVVLRCPPGLYYLQLNANGTWHRYKLRVE